MKDRAARPPTLVIGVGNDYGGDDGVGLRVAREIGALGLDGLRVVTVAGDCTRLVGTWTREDRVFLVDAAFSSSVPGAIHRMEATDGPLPEEPLWRASTHSFGVAEAIELARALRQMPRRLVVYGVEGKTFTPGFGLSREVDRSVDRVVRRILEELRS